MHPLTVLELRKALDTLENAGKVDGATLVFAHVPSTNQVFRIFEVRQTPPLVSVVRGRVAHGTAEQHVRLILEPES